ncbi:hypothetical protein BDF19DRAFT_498067 [Syncephalis fuscata]|nr:hypothetical protein BDF19DRAFT_498067 [Syncephalis fuscata]
MFYLIKINYKCIQIAEKSLNHYSLVQIQELQQELNGMRQREVHYIEIIQQQAKKLHSTNVGSSGFSNESIRDNNEISDKLLDDLVTDSKMSANNALIVQNLEENLLQANSNTDFYHLRVNEYESTMQNLYVQLQAAFAISNVPSYSKYSNENSQEKAAIYKTENDDLLHLKFQQTEPLFMDGRALSVVNNAPYSLEAFSRGIIQLLDRYRRLVIHQQLVASGQAENAEGHAWSASVSNFPIPGTNVLSAQYPTNNTKRADSSIAIPSTIFNPPVSSFETQNESKAAWDQARAQTVYQHLNQFPSPRTSEDHPTASRGSDNNERIRLLEDEIELLRERDTQARMFIARLGRKNNQDQTSSSSLN